MPSLFECASRSRLLESDEIRGWMKQVESTLQERMDAEIAGMKDAFVSMEESFMTQLDKWLSGFEDRLKRNEDSHQAISQKVEDFCTQSADKSQLESQHAQLHREHRFRLHALEARMNQKAIDGVQGMFHEYSSASEEITDSARLAALEMRVDQMQASLAAWQEELRIELASRLQNFQEEQFVGREGNKGDATVTQLTARLRVLELQTDQLLSDSVGREPSIIASSSAATRQFPAFNKNQGIRNAQ